MRVLLDLDCVLADFVGGAAAAHGMTVEEILPHWPRGEYAMQTAVGRAKGDPLWDDRDFWTPFNGRRDFWANLPVLPWARELVTLVGLLGAATGRPGITIVTSPSECPECVPGKRDWCDRFFGPGNYDLIAERDKWKLADPRTALIDDYDKNLRLFADAGGFAVGFPAHHNCLYNFASDPMAYVKETLRCLRPTTRPAWSE